MSVQRVVCGASLCALALACGERAGDPVVRLADSPTRAGTDGGGAAGSPPGGAAGQGGAQRAGPSGLCSECFGSAACGDANDACLRHDDQRFCGRDCQEGYGCPDGYVCVELDNSQLQQCVPTEGCPGPVLAVPALAQLREYLLARINLERLERERAPLQASPCLDELAQASALDFAWTDEPLGKFAKECDPIWPNCSCGWSAQAEVAVSAYGLDWLRAIERALGYRTGDDRFIESFLDFDVRHVGIGFWISGDEAWIALSFR